MDKIKRPALGPSSFYRRALGIALPAMLQQLILSLVSLVDSFMVAGLGDVSMAAVNVANQLNFVYFIVTNILSMAGGIYISQFSGAKDGEGMAQAYRFNILSTALVAIAYFILCQAIPGRMLGVMLSGNAAGAQIMAEGSDYLKTVSWHFLAFGFSSASATAMRVCGDSRRPLIFSVLATLVNTALNWVLIYGNLGAPRLGVVGAAIATNVARLVEAFFFAAYLLVARPQFSFRISGLLRIKPKIFAAIVSRSWMMLFSECTWVLTETLLTALFNGRGGAETVAGVASGFTIANIFFMAFNGIHTATGAIVGPTLGSGKLDEARDQAAWILSGSLCMGLGLGALEAFSVVIIPLVFGNLSPAAQGITRSMVFVVSAFMPLWTLLNAQFAVSRSGGDALLGFMVDVLVSLFLFVPLALLLARFTGLGPVALFACVKSTDAVKTVVAAWWLKKERWVRNLAAEHSA